MIGETQTRNIFRIVNVSQVGYRSRAKSRTEKVDPKKAVVELAGVE